MPLGIVLAFWLAHKYRKSSGWKIGVATVVVGLLIAVLIELAQVRIPGRDSTLHDVVLGGGGVVVGLFVYRLISFLLHSFGEFVDER